jgi:AraC-like DNA-binding protein
MELLRKPEIGLASIEQVARELGMSVRTLQRRLRLEGVSFEEIGDDIRTTLAKSYLRDSGMSISEVSYLLGFSEPSAFSRAFRNWTGTSPQDFRRAEHARISRDRS